MQTNPESSAVEAVAWRYWSATHPSHVNVLGPGQYEYMDAGKWHPDHAEPLYPQSALDALRGEVESERKLRMRAEGLCSQWITRHDFALESLNELTVERNIQRERADASERRVAELERVCKPIIEKSVAISKTTSSVFTSDLRRLLSALTKVTP